MERRPAIFGFEVNFAGIRDFERQRPWPRRRQFACGFRQTLARKLVFRVELKSRPKLRRCPRPSIFQHQQVSLLDVLEDQLCLHHFARSQKLHILRG